VQRNREINGLIPVSAPVSDDGYVVEVKRSARKVSPGAGRWVREHGTRHRFASKALARQWAREVSPPGRTVWVQDAVPADTDPVDGYVVGGRRTRPRRHVDPGEQASLADVGE
jgi:hypothetical protein